MGGDKTFDHFLQVGGFEDHDSGVGDHDGEVGDGLWAVDGGRRKGSSKVERIHRRVDGDEGSVVRRGDPSTQSLI